MIWPVPTPWGPPHPNTRLCSFKALGLLLLAMLVRRRRRWPLCGHARPGLPRWVLSWVFKYQLWLQGFSFSA